MLERGTINSGLPHDYLHENLISLFSAAKESSFVPYLSPVVVFLPHHPGTFIMEVVKMHGLSNFFRDEGQV